MFYNSKTLAIGMILLSEMRIYSRRIPGKCKISYTSLAQTDQTPFGCFNFWSFTIDNAKQ